MASVKRVEQTAPAHNIASARPGVANKGEKIDRSGQGAPETEAAAGDKQPSGTGAAKVKEAKAKEAKVKATTAKVTKVQATSTKAATDKVATDNAATDNATAASNKGHWVHCPLCGIRFSSLNTKVSYRSPRC